MRQSGPQVNCLLLGAVLLSACEDPHASTHPLLNRDFPLGATREVLAASPRAESSLEDMRARGHLPAPAPFDWGAPGTADPMPPPGPEDLDLSALGPPIDAQRLDEELGAALTAYLDDNPAVARRVEQYGVGGLTYEEQFGTTGEDGLCEEPAAIVALEGGGRASYSLGIMAHFIINPEIYYENITPACVADIVEAGGSVEVTAACDEYYVETFYPEGSACRACIQETGGAWSTCVEEDACQATAPLKGWVRNDEGEIEWFTTLTSTILACAPDLAGPMYVFAQVGEDERIPDPWDHAGWAYFCTPYYDGSLNYACSGGDNGWQLGHTLGAGALGRVNYVRGEGEDGEPFHNRLWYGSEISIGGRSLNQFWATTPGVGQISEPRSGPIAGRPEVDLAKEPYGGWGAAWGFNPYALRPGGTDPSNLDDTLARDWLATLTLKTATTRDGVYIATYAQNRCASWEGPYADGSHFCSQLLPPELGTWPDGPRGPAVYFDNYADWSEDDFKQIVYFPIATIGSTGLPDPLVPGGNTVLVAGTAALADPDWDDCAWSHQFVPDTLVLEDFGSGWGGAGSVWGDTYRFGKDPDLDLRVVLNTNEARGYCATE